MDRNNTLAAELLKMGMSLSARRAWIEISDIFRTPHRSKVALRKESVDRNQGCYQLLDGCAVVALRKESVDRNRYYFDVEAANDMSLSARRAWIEIPKIR